MLYKFLSKDLHAQSSLRTSASGTTDNVQLIFFSYSANAIANAQCERDLKASICRIHQYSSQ